MKVNYRSAVAADSHAVFELIRRLAVYEKLEHEVTGSEAMLKDSLFPTSGEAKVQCRVAEVNNQLVGFALYFWTYSTFLTQPGIYLEDLFVIPEYRGKGIGKRLLSDLANEVVGKNGGRLEWSVLDWNEPSIKFYELLGAKPQKEWIKYRLDSTSLLNLAKGEAR